MNKAFINKYCRKFGFEIHGTGFLQSVRKSAFKEDALLVQQEICGKDVKVIFDIGANVGDISIQYAQLFPQSHIYAFEPFFGSFSILKKKIEGIPKIAAYQFAIAENEGKRKLYVNHNADTNSLLEPKKMGLSSDKEVANKGAIEVAVLTIDDFCTHNGINTIDILKMDIQGGELAALKGATKMLTEKRIGLIYTEAYFRQQYVDQPLFHDISTFLVQYGYYVQDLYTPIYGKGALAWCDAIFVRTP